MFRNPAAKVYIFSYKSQSQRRDMYYIGCFGTFFMYWRPSPVHLDYIDTGFMLFYCQDIGMSVILRSWLPGVLRVQKVNPAGPSEPAGLYVRLLSVATPDRTS